MKRVFVIVALLLTCRPLAAQEPVNEAADIIRWGTAVANPLLGAVRAIRSDDPGCRLSQEMISLGIGLGGALVLQHLIVSPRPCLGCPPNGQPSAHSAASVAGALSGWRHDIGFGFSVTMAVGTAGLSVASKRHTRAQAIAGLALGVAGEAVSHWVVHCGEEP